MADSSPKNDESFPVISKDVSKTISSNIDTQKFSDNKTIIQVKTNEINDKDSDLVNKEETPVTDERHGAVMGLSQYFRGDFEQENNSYRESQGLKQLKY